MYDKMQSILYSGLLAVKISPSVPATLIRKSVNLQRFQLLLLNKISPKIRDMIMAALMHIIFGYSRNFLDQNCQQSPHTGKRDLEALGDWLLLTLQ